MNVPYTHFTWRKMGRKLSSRASPRVDPNPRRGSHGAAPLGQYLSGVPQRPRCSSRSVVAWYEADAADGWRVIRMGDRPALSPGLDGRFDDCGTMGSCLLPVGDELWLYYVGWNRGYRVPFYNNIGLAASTDGGLTFDRKSVAPIVPRDDFDPIFTASPCVLHEDGVFHLWYPSCREWRATPEGPRHYYDLRYAAWSNGQTWHKHTGAVMRFASPDEYAICRAFVVKKADGYAMWFCSRGEHYRISYAESPNGIEWRRMPYGGLDVSPEGWDSEMAAYPCVVEHDGALFMLYNGNGYGATGIGLAIAQ